MRNQTAERIVFDDSEDIVGDDRVGELASQLATVHQLPVIQRLERDVARHPERDLAVAAVPFAALGILAARTIFKPRTP